MQSPDNLPRWAAGLESQPLRPAPVERSAPERAAAAPQPVAAPQASAAPQRGQSAGLTIHDPNARVEGRFEVAGNMEIGCELTGEILAQQLLISESGVVQAAVRTVDAVIRGSFAGELVATGSVEISATGRVSGTIRTSELVIARGAVFTGSVEQLEAEAPELYAEPQPVAQTPPLVAEPIIAAAVELADYDDDAADDDAAAEQLAVAESPKPEARNGRARTREQVTTDA